MPEVKPIARIHSPFKTKFGIPRQSGVAEAVRAEIVFEPEYRNPDAVRGLAEYSHIWLIWQFSEAVRDTWSPTVRPPRLGGNVHVGVFATRSPFRPNSLGLSSVELERVELTPDRGPVLHIKGADLMDGTPIYDIKPYLPEFDSHGEAKAGFVDTCQWTVLDVEASPDVDLSVLSAADLAVVKQLLSQDPRPQYHRSPDRIYGMPYKQLDIRFKVVGRTAMIVGITDDCGQ